MAVSNVVPISAASAQTALQLLAERFKVRGPHPEYAGFRDSASARALGILPTTSISAFGLISDAVDGRGGFVNGNYLIPHPREWKNGALVAKFWERTEATAYENFARTICDGPWNYIVQAADMIQRQCKSGSELEAFWSNVDGQETGMTDFLEYPARQARMYGTAWIGMDRPVFDPRSQLENYQDGNRPYLYCVPTESVVDWQFAPDHTLTSVTILESMDRGYDGGSETMRLRIHTRQAWGHFEKSVDGEWAMVSSGQNLVGRVPFIRLHDEKPNPGSALGRSIMISVAQAARKHYNLSAEIRELERKCAFAMLALPLDNPADVNKIVLGTESLLPFSTKGGMPAWIEPHLDSIDKLDADRKTTRESAFGNAQMGALMGFEQTIQTSSGFHTEAEFDKTNRRIGKFAASLETAEREIARLYLDFMGLGNVKSSEVEITYPRDFGLRDLEKLQARTQARLEMRLGIEDATKALEEYYSALEPRQNAVDRRAQAARAAEAYYNAQQQPTATSQERVARLLQRVRGKRPPAAVAGAPAMAMAQ